MFVFGAILCCLILLFPLLYLRMISRGFTSSSWPQAQGRVKSFVYSRDAQELEYEYAVDGAPFTGWKITVGDSRQAKRPVGHPKKMWLNPDLSLKYPPGAPVTVYYNPRDAADAALVVGPSSALRSFFIVEGLLALSLLANLIIGANRHEDFAPVLIGAAFVLGGVGTVWFGLKCLARHGRTQDFPTVRGKLLRADIAYESDSDSSGFAATVEYEYSVNGVTYRSRQIPALPAKTLKSKKAAQRDADSYNASPGLEIFYDPRAPWDSFLRRGPAWCAWFPIVLGMAFAIGGFALWYHHIPRH
jgi:hypothetical protein